MRREIENVRYNHEPGRSEMTMDVTIIGASETRLRIETVDAGGTTAVTIEDDFHREGIAALMENEDVGYEVALGEIAGVLTDLEKAERMNRAARQGLSDHVLTAITVGGGVA